MTTSQSLAQQRVSRLEALRADDLLELRSITLSKLQIEKDNLEVRKELTKFKREVTRLKNVNRRLTTENKTLLTQSGNREIEQKSLLDKANSIIRQANRRISELKEQLKYNTNGSPNTKEDCWQVLGLRRGSTTQLELKKRYKLLSVCYHPDKSGSDVMMKKINAAYEQAYKQL